MGMRWAAARVAAAATRWACRHVFHRAATNLPGKAALLIDPHAVEHAMEHVEHSILVTGTNGKTTATNLIASALERDGLSVACNREGANMASGVASALLKDVGQGKTLDWAVLECDELWTTKVAASVQPDVVVLLDLFRDQLDRCGETAHVEQAIVYAMRSAPGAVLLYNADDPRCQSVADNFPDRSAGFGIDCDLPGRLSGWQAGGDVDADTCRECGGVLRYSRRLYQHLGDYRCERCGNGRREPRFATESFSGEDGQAIETVDRQTGERTSLPLPVPAPYLAHTALAVWGACELAGADRNCAGSALADMPSIEGRMQEIECGRAHVVVNLAKNPAGMDHALGLASKTPAGSAVVVMINDAVADGRDVSWLWDCAFDVLAGKGLSVYAGGSRRDDVALRMKYAGVKAAPVDELGELMLHLGSGGERDVFVIANYTALSPAVAAVEKAGGELGDGRRRDVRDGMTDDDGDVAISDDVDDDIEPTPCHLELEHPLRILHVYPDLLGLYGDRGNVEVLRKRCEWRGIPVQVDNIHIGDPWDLGDADIVFIGGGPDREQGIAWEGMSAHAGELRGYAQDGGVLLAVCGGYQMLGRSWQAAGGMKEGVGLFKVDTCRRDGAKRLVGDVAVTSVLAAVPIVGYANHAGRTVRDCGQAPLGRVASGLGDEGRGGLDGAVSGHVVGTYLHGPVLARSPEFADRLIAWGLSRRAGREVPIEELGALGDGKERIANKQAIERAKTRGSMGARLLGKFKAL